mgnify:CR=1 FL=1
MRLSSLAIVDLAGSERSNKTNTVGVRAKEASKINTSLMTFGKCIEALKYNQTVRAHACICLCRRLFVRTYVGSLTYKICSTFGGQHQNKLLPPFRESKLTRLCQEYFTGAGKVLTLPDISTVTS